VAPRKSASRERVRISSTHYQGGGSFLGPTERSEAGAVDGATTRWGAAERGSAVGQAGTAGFDSEYSVRGEMSAPFGHTMVPASGSTLTWLKTL
jgi:hypothetical protein